MLQDASIQFANATALKLNATDNTLHGDVYDTGSAPTLKDIAAGTELVLTITFTTSVTSNGAATVSFTLLTDSTSTLASSATTHITTPLFSIASMTAGNQYTYILPPQATYERYMGIFASIGTQTLNAGAFTAGIGLKARRDIGHTLPDALTAIPVTA